jgi:hypothetical protein
MNVILSNGQPSTPLPIAAYIVYFWIRRNNTNLGSKAVVARPSGCPNRGVLLLEADRHGEQVLAAENDGSMRSVRKKPGSTTVISMPSCSK